MNFNAQTTFSKCNDMNRYISTPRRARLQSLWLALIAIGLWMSPVHADSLQTEYAVETMHESDSRVASTLIFSDVQVQPGDTFRVGVAFEIDPSWYIYWQNPGDAGIPTDIQWSGEHLEFGPLTWAAPSSFVAEETLSHGYDNQVVLYSDVTVSEAAEGSLRIGADIDYLACKDMCLPGYASLSRNIQIGDETIAADERVRALMEASEKRVPQRAEDVGLQADAHFSRTAVEDDVEIVLELIACETPSDDCEEDLTLAEDNVRAMFIADGYSSLDLEVREVREHPTAERGWLFYMHGELREPRPTKKCILSGVVTLQTASLEQRPVYVSKAFQIADAEHPALAQPLPTWDEPGALIAKNGDAPPLKDTSQALEEMPDIAVSAGIPLDGEDKAPNFFLMILMAFLGGIILNLMPCVFPVLALKISSFATLVHESRTEVIRHGSAYTAGIVGSMWLLAAAVVALRLTGTQVGWGFQFQQPGFLAALIVILVLFSLNLFGVFEIAVSPQRLTDTASEAVGIKRSFFEGVLAVVLATPCSAPFLGAAIGFALTGSVFVIFAIFTAMALGLAAPLVVLMLVPGWAKLLPQPGNWMVHLKIGLGFALMGSAIWIVWLLGRASGVDAMGAIMMFSGFVAMAAWLYGLVQFQSFGRGKASSLILAAALVVTGAYLAFPLPHQIPSGDMESSSNVEWTPWTDEGVQEALAEGRPVFVDFTADWCLTCKVNKRNAIDTPKTEAAIEKYNVAAFRADWTHENEDIRAKLQEFNRAGIPFYLVYSPENPTQPWTLSEIITERSLISALKRAAGDTQ